MPSQAHAWYQLFTADYFGIGYILSLYLLLGIFEFKFPADTKQRLSGRLTNLLVAGLFLGLGIWMTKRLLQPLGLHPRRAPDRGLLFSIGLIMTYGFAEDFIFYWYHRSQHRFDLLWPIHELHHTDTELNATTSLRSYWLEKPLQTTLIGVPLIFLVRMDARAALLAPIFLRAWLFLAHANLRLSLGFLTPVFCGPQVHRIHHSNLPEHQNRNFAQFFPCIDVLFGTYYAPRRDEFPATGLNQRTAPASISEIVLGPFQPWSASLSRLLATRSRPSRRIPATPSPRRSRPSRRRRTA
jgi:sterol desaturase/sphingolipid hydroxylase (fatty acid hydroxylase superfamily)